MSTVLNTGLFLPFGKRGVDRLASEAAIIQDLICYDSVWVFTDQMSAVPRLIEIMGMSAFEKAVTDGALKFVHDRHILAWPKVTGYQGVVPFQAFGSMSDSELPKGFSHESTIEIVTKLLLAYPIPFRRARDLARKIDSVTEDFGATPSTLMRSKSDVDADLQNTLQLYEEAVSSLQDFPLRRRDLIQLRRDLRNPNRSPLESHGKKQTYRVMTLQQFSGPQSMSPQQALPEKQLAMLNLALTDRFLASFQRHPEIDTLHTEPAVEQILVARAAAVRRAAASEIEVILDYERVCLPVLRIQENFPYSELLHARESRSGEAFRKLVVEPRDKDKEAELMHEYLAALDKSISDRFSVSVGRFITTTVLGLVNPVVGIVAGGVDALGANKLFSRTTARYYIDSILRRMGKHDEPEPWRG